LDTLQDKELAREIDFKPIIGLRPFLINGQSQNYKFWEDNGFRTLDNYFPGLKLRTDSAVDPNGKLHQALIDAIKQLAALSPDELLDLYNRMLPDLLYNRQRWYAWVDEQHHKVNNLFNERFRIQTHSIRPPLGQFLCGKMV
jgi:hypothetical protein